MQTEEEGSAISCAGGEDGFGAVGKEVGEVAGLVDKGVALPEVKRAVSGGAGSVGEVVDPAHAVAKELVIAALEGAGAGESAEVPLADEAGVIPGGSEQGGESGMGRRNSDDGGAGGDGLLEADREAVLIAAGEEGGARGGTDAAVGVGLGETDALGGEPVEVGRLVVAAAREACANEDVDAGALEGVSAMIKGVA